MATMFSTVPYLGLAGDLAGVELPAEPRPPEQVERRLVVLHLGRRHQRGQHGPGLAAVDHRVVVIPEARAALGRAPRRRIRVGRPGAEVGGAPIRTARPGAIGTPRLADPVVAFGGGRGELGARLVRQRDRQKRGIAPSALPILVCPRVVAIRAGGSEKPREVGFDGEARLERIERGIGRDVGRVDVELLPPHQTRRHARFDDRLEEAAEDVQSGAVAQAGEAGLVREPLRQVVAQAPAQAQTIGHHPQQLAFGTQPFEEEDQLHLKEDDRVDRGPADVGVGPADQVADEAEVERVVEMAIKVTGRNEVLKRDADRVVQIAGFRWSTHDRLRAGGGKHHIRSLSVASPTRSTFSTGRGPTATVSEIVREEDRWIRSRSASLEAQLYEDGDEPPVTYAKTARC